MNNGNKSEILVCSFTGHRKIEPHHEGKIDTLVMRAIEYAYGRGCRAFYTGGAVGFDTVAAKQVILFRMSHPDVRLTVLVPCREQSERWSDRQKQMYDYCLSSADFVEYVSEAYTDDCMKKRNQRLVDAADTVIAYASHSRSGAGQTVRMAQRAGKTVYNLYPTLEKS